MLTEIRSAGPKGLGLFAKSLIPRGTRILSEKPLLSCPSSQPSQIFRNAQQLSKSEKQELLSLSSYDGTGIQRVGRWWSTTKWTIADVLLQKKKKKKKNESYALRSGIWSENLRILNIFRSNCFDVDAGDDDDENDRTLYLTIARINHSCVPNAQANWHPSLRRFNVHALRDIERGEEVEISYRAEDGQLREGRQRELQEGYGFLCACPACLSSSLLSAPFEKRRAEMQNRMHAFADRFQRSEATDGEKGSNEYDFDTEKLAVSQAFIDMFEAEGGKGRELASLYVNVAKLHELLGRREEALQAMRMGAAIEKVALGADHPLVAKAEEDVKELEERR